MMEFSDIATIGLVVYGITCQGVRYLRTERQMRMAREFLVKLQFPADIFPGDPKRLVVLAFDERGCLVRKYPEKSVVALKNTRMIQCKTPEGSMSFRVLYAPTALNLSGVHRIDDISNRLSEVKGLLIAGSEIREINHNITMELKLSANGTMKDEEHTQPPASSLSMLLSPELVTDAMAKEFAVDLKRCGEEWSTGSIHYDEGELDNWLSIRREGDRLVLQFRANFNATEREARVELNTAEQACRFKVRQQVMGVYPGLTVSRNLYVTSGDKNEVVQVTVTPESEETRWQIKSANAGDGGCWYSVHPPVSVFQNGTRTLRVHMEAKPAGVRSRSLVLVLETGTYPFSQTTEVTLMQGICFDYYIEYPKKDPCARHNGVIETPMDYGADEPLKRYTVCVNSNQAWRIVQKEKADWIEVSEPELLQGLYGGRFTILVSSNASNKVKNGFPAARHTILSLVNDTGIVKDLLIYQGGYVRIRGKYWLDRNLSADGGLAQVAIPLGLEVGSTLNHGGYFQFGRKIGEWSEVFSPCGEDWYAGKRESPVARTENDPSPVGWRVPSDIEIEGFASRPAAPMELQREEDRTNICILSDDGVPVYLPLCGHLSHINGCRIVIPHGHRYWTGTSQSTVYGYSLCVEPSRQMYIMHDMKKYGFPIRCILDGE